MANKPVTADVSGTSIYAPSVINSNNGILEEAIENGLGRGGTSESNNSMSGDLDMDLNKIQNVGNGSADNDAVNVSQLAAAGTLTATNASTTVYNQGGTSAVNTTVEAKLQENVSILDFGAVAGGVVDSTAAIQAAIDTGKNVYVPSGTYLISTTLTMSTEGQRIFGEGNASVITTASAITMLEFTTSRYQTIENLKIDGDSVALYGVVIDFPKCGLINAHVEGCVTAGVWMGYFSTFVTGRSRVINNIGIGILIQDKTGQVNEIRITDSIISANTSYGIRFSTSSRDGLYISGCNMENNANSVGTSHIKCDNVRGIYISDMYHENSYDNAGNFFYDFDSSPQTVSINNIKMNDSASVTPMDYFIRIGGDGGDVMRNCHIQNIQAAGFAQKLLLNGMDTNKSNYCKLENIYFGEAESNENLASNGTALDIFPRRSTLRAGRTGTNQTFGAVAETALFNTANGETVAASIDAKITPASYDPATGFYDVFESGLYRLSGVISVTAPSSGVYFRVYLFKGSSSIFGPFYSSRGDGVKNCSLSYDGTIECDAGDQVRVMVEASTGTLDLRLGGSSLTVEKVGTQYGINL